MSGEATDTWSMANLPIFRTSSASSAIVAIFNEVGLSDPLCAKAMSCRAK